MTNHAENLEKIRKACIVAVPSIMDLKFGCKVYFQVGNSNTKLYGLIIDSDNEWFDVKPMAYPTQYLFQKDIIEILGREIQLADVLMAIGDKGLVSMKIVMAGDVACASFIWGWGKPNQQNVVWNLKQPLSGQTPETILFLSQLLK